MANRGLIEVGWGLGTKSCSGGTMEEHSSCCTGISCLCPDYPPPFPLPSTHSVLDALQDNISAGDEATDIMKWTAGIVGRANQCWSRLLQSGFNTFPFVPYSVHPQAFVQMNSFVFTQCLSYVSHDDMQQIWMALSKFLSSTAETHITSSWHCLCEEEHKAATPECAVLNVERTGALPFGCPQIYRVGVKEEEDGGWEGLCLNLLFHGFDLRCQRRSWGTCVTH